MTTIAIIFVIALIVFTAWVLCRAFDKEYVANKSIEAAKAIIDSAPCLRRGIVGAQMRDLCDRILVEGEYITVDGGRTSIGIKAFPYDHNDPEDKSYKIRCAEELIEKLLE